MVFSCVWYLYKRKIGHRHTRVFAVLSRAALHIDGTNRESLHVVERVAEVIDFRDAALHVRGTNLALSTNDKANAETGASHYLKVR